MFHSKNIRFLFSILCVTFFIFSVTRTDAAFFTLEDEYTPKYCLQLEVAYGKGLMSEGGELGIEHMFEEIPLTGKTALDIGSGIGGVAFYLAQNHGMQVTGLEVNPWMVSESIKRTPAQLMDKVDFLLSNNNSNWPLPERSFDIVYSKGVLTHIQEKDEVFQECRRLLKEDGLLVITDWLSSEEKGWGSNIAKLVELEHLTLYAESEKGYIELLRKNGFSVESVREDSFAYLAYNRKIIERLKEISKQQAYLDIFDSEELQASITGYSAIANALEEGELRVMRFVAKKQK